MAIVSHSGKGGGGGEAAALSAVAATEVDGATAGPVPVVEEEDKDEDEVVAADLAAPPLASARLAGKRKLSMSRATTGLPFASGGK